MRQTPCFYDVKSILDRLVRGRTGNLRLLHGDTFDWSTRDNLLMAVVQPGGLDEYRLIDPELARQGRGSETNLVIALVRGVSDFSRMPLDGPYASDQDIQTIIEWINIGMPE